MELSVESLKCIGCRICEYACNYHQDMDCSPNGASLMLHRADAPYLAGRGTGTEDTQADFPAAGVDTRMIREYAGNLFGRMRRSSIARKLSALRSFFRFLEREGMVGARGREIGIHAVRAGDIVGEHTVIFAGNRERIELTHRAHSRMAFAEGCITAIRWIAPQRDGRVHGMDEVLGL